MSAAVDNAEVMLSCISLAYKESASKNLRTRRCIQCANCLLFSRLFTHAVHTCVRACPDCRLEMQYGHQQGVEMIPLMMENGYRPTGWRKSQYLYLVLRIYGSAVVMPLTWNNFARSWPHHGDSLVL